jgi:hypothetical protein
MAYDRLDPIGGQRLDFHFASILSTMHNLTSAVHSKRKTSPSTVSDFMVEWHGEKKEQDGVMSPEQIKQFFVSMKERKERQAERQRLKEERRASRKTNKK